MKRLESARAMKAATTKEEEVRKSNYSKKRTAVSKKEKRTEKTAHQHSCDVPSLIIFQVSTYRTLALKPLMQPRN